MSKYQELLDEIDNNHCWSFGQTWGHGGTAYSSTDKCRICNLKRKYYTDSQNDIDEEYTFFIDEQEISLREASELEC